MIAQGPREAQPSAAAGTPPAMLHPWWIVAAMVIGLSVGTGAIAHYVMGPLIKVLSAEFGWSRSTVSAGVSMFFMGAAFSFVLFGALIDRWGPRRADILSVCLLALPMLLLPLIEQQWQFYGVLLAMGLGGGGATATPYVKAISGRFGSRRGLALGIGAAGVGLGGIILPFYMAHTLANYGWRTAIVGLAFLVVTVAVPTMWFGLAGVKTMGRNVSAPSHSDFSLWRSRSYWIIAVAIALVSFAVNGIIVHAVPLLTDRGITPAHAAAAMSGVAITSVVARIVGGYLMDVFFAPAISALLFLLVALGVVLRR